jgi:hypothetical protein
LSRRLHFRVNAKPFIPRPLESSKWNCAIPSSPLRLSLYSQEAQFSKQPFEYVLVLKNDFSGFVEFIPAIAVDHFVVAVQWYLRFGMSLMHVSDQGSHVKDEFIKEFNRILQINHHMTTSYSPWANGTVEKVNNDIQKLLRFLLSEWQMKSSPGYFYFL